MIFIQSYYVVNGTRSELIPYESEVSDVSKLSAVKSYLMQLHDGHRIDLVYYEPPEQIQEPEPEPVIEVPKKDLSGVILRNSKIIRNFINSLKN